MKITDNDQPEIQMVEALPSRREVEDAVNPRARNDEMDGQLPRTRTPFGVGRLKLSVTKIPGFHLHWIADYPGRLDNAVENGYEFVKREEVQISRHTPNADLGEYVCAVDNSSHATGQPLKLYLMKIRQDWYEENQQFYLQRVRATERQIKTGKVDGMLDKDMYIPRGRRISVDTKLE